MKMHRFTLLPIFSLLFFTLSQAFHFQPRDLLTEDLTTSTVDLKPDHHHDSPSDGSDSKILLPSQPKPEAVEETNKVPGSTGFMNLDIGPLVNRHQVHLRNRFPFPRVLRFFPRLCHHHHHHNGGHRQQEQRFFRFERPDRRFDDGVKWGPGRPREADQEDVVGLMFKKNGGGPYAEIVRQRHVARENVREGADHRETAVEEPMMVYGQFKPMHPLDPRPRPHHHHHDHHHDHGDEMEDRTVEIKREKEEKMGRDGEEEKEEKQQHHRHRHRHHHREEERENGLMKKIRKFLVLI